MKLSHLVAAGASAALVILAAGSASAQSQGGNGPQTAQQAAGGAIGRMTSDQQTWRFESEEHRPGEQTLTPEEYEARYGAERMDLARRVQDLVDQGQCREARELANAEGDRNMALRVRQTCRRR